MSAVLRGYMTDFKHHLFFIEFECLCINMFSKNYSL